MFPRPVAVGLNLCDYVILEEGTRKISLIGCLAQCSAGTFPFTAPPFYAHAVLTDCQGEGRMELVVTRLETDEEVYRWRARVRFPARLRQTHVYFRVTDCSLPAPGAYHFALLVDRELVAQCRIRVVGSQE
jgi:hypothetical protein